MQLKYVFQLIASILNCVNLQSCLPRRREKKKLFPPGFEPGTFRVLGERDNHYTTETDEIIWERH